MIALAFLVFAVDTPRVDPCWLCLTEYQARQAADNTLLGEKAKADLVVLKAQKRYLQKYAEGLEYVIQKDSLADMQAHANFNTQQRMTEYWEEQYKARGKKATGKTLVWTLIGILTGAYLKTVL
jgi:hypothetical protein